jgi:hypothetical protein
MNSSRNASSGSGSGPRFANRNFNAAIKPVGKDTKTPGNMRGSTVIATNLTQNILPP